VRQPDHQRLGQGHLLRDRQSHRWPGDTRTTTEVRTPSPRAVPRRHSESRHGSRTLGRRRHDLRRLRLGQHERQLLVQPFRLRGRDRDPGRLRRPALNPRRPLPPVQPARQPDHPGQPSSSLTMGTAGTITGGTVSFSLNQRDTQSRSLSLGSATYALIENADGSYSLDETGTETLGLDGAVVSGADSFTWEPVRGQHRHMALGSGGGYGSSPGPERFYFVRLVNYESKHLPRRRHRPGSARATRSSPAAIPTVRPGSTRPTTRSPTSATPTIPTSSPPRATTNLSRNNAGTSTPDHRRGTSSLTTSFAWSELSGNSAVTRRYRRADSNSTKISIGGGHRQLFEPGLGHDQPFGWRRQHVRQFQHRELPLGHGRRGLHLEHLDRIDQLPQ